MKTSYNYINEYRDQDIFNEFLNMMNESMENDYKTHKQNIADLEISVMFESSIDREFMIESENESFLGKVGSSLLKFIEKISDFIKSIGEKLTGLFKKTESEQEKVQRIIEENPELKKELAQGIQKGWYTYKDIATYEKNVIGLINLIEQGKIDNKTAMDKFKEFAGKFTSSAAPLLAVGGTIGAILGLAPTILGNVHKTQKTLNNIKKEATKASKNKDKDKQSFIANILSKFSADVTQETTNAVENEKRTFGIFKWFNKKHGSEQEETTSDTSKENKPDEKTKKPETKKRKDMSEQDVRDRLSSNDQDVL